jgi:hypothetical protein
MTDSNLAIVMIDRTDIEAIVQNPVAMIDVLHREAKHAMTLKKLDL